MESIPVSLAIKPSTSHGYAAWVRSLINNEDVWWKWYEDAISAWSEAVTLNIAIRQDGPGVRRFSKDVHWNSKPHAMLSPERLISYGFGPPPTNA